MTADHIRAIASPTDLVKVSGKVDEALEAFGTAKIGYLPLRDGSYVDAEGVLSALKKGTGSQVPLLVGSNAEEMQLFIAAFGPYFQPTKRWSRTGFGSCWTGWQRGNRRKRPTPWKSPPRAYGRSSAKR